MRAFVHESLPGRVVFGAGAVDQVATEVQALGDPRRTLVIATGSAKPIGERIAEALGPRLADQWGDVRQHVPEDLAAAATARARDAGADAVVAIGGGSAIGLGKVIAVDREVPLVAVPTTYSGSEMTPIYGVTGRHKRTVRDRRAQPAVAVYDPELTVGLSPRVTASSGFNALAHAVEGLYAPGANPVTSLWAEEAIRQLAAALPRLAGDGDDREARHEALFGAYLAGATLAVAGIALHHKLCHVLGGTFGLNHADVHAVLLPHVAAYNASAVPEQLAGAATALGGAGVAAEVGGRLYDLAYWIGAPTSLTEIGMPSGHLDEVAALAVTAVGDANPRPIDVKAIRTLLEAATAGSRP